jgi:hypothetical protein
VDAEDAANPTKGKCVKVECKDANGADLCDATRKCVNAKDPQNSTKGECRIWCRIPNSANPNACAAGLTCVGIEKQEVDELGTCEEGCFMDRDCGIWVACEDADANNLTPGTCAEVVPLSDECRDDDDCGQWEVCKDADSTTLALGDCKEVELSHPQCRDDNDCTADPARPKCNGADAATPKLGTCEA